MTPSTEARHWNLVGALRAEAARRHAARKRATAEINRVLHERHKNRHPITVHLSRGGPPVRDTWSELRQRVRERYGMAR